MARVRGQTYHDYAWPPTLGRLYERNGLTLSLALAAGLALFLLLAVLLKGGPDGLWSATPAGGSFYDLFPHNLMVGLFAPVFLFAVLALALGVRRFWREITPVTSGAPLSAPATFEATHDVLRLKYLDGGHGEGCHNDDDAYTLSRRRFHHLTFYGFLLCFAATSVATLYHYLLGQPAPYELPSLPKLLGAVGGVMLVAGTAGLGWLNLHRHPLHGDAAQKPMDLGFIALLFLVSASGLGLWVARGTPAMALLLCLHLGAVMALFATLPYGKFAHAPFRLAALLKHALGERADRLDIALDRPAFGKNGIAAGIDKNLLAGLRAMAKARRLRLSSLQPRLIAELAAHRQQLDDGWFACLDQGWLTLAGLRDGDVASLRNHRASTADPAILAGELSGLLAAETAWITASYTRAPEYGPSCPKPEIDR